MTVSEISAGEVVLMGRSADQLRDIAGLIRQKTNRYTFSPIYWDDRLRRHILYVTSTPAKQSQLTEAPRVI